MLSRCFVLAVLLALAVGAQAAWAQGVPDSLRTDRGAPADTVRTDAPGGTPDSLRGGPSGGRPGAQPGRPGAGGSPGGGSVEGAVSMAAQDSLVIRMDSTGGDTGTLYGNAQMSYQEATLKAREIEMNFDADRMTARGAPSDSAQSRPSFTRSGTEFTGSVLSFNIRTQRGRVVTARTQQREGFIQGETVKVYEDSTLFVRDGVYTTCDCPPDETPSYSLRSNRMKVQEKWVYTGPIQLFLFNIPTPLWLPFGFLPATEGRRSGPLPPEYGSSNDGRGLFLKDWGWYFAMNDYMDLQLRAGIWSQGSFEINPIYRYEKRYEYGGRLSVEYSRFKTGEREDPGFTDRREGRLRWNHDQDLSPTARLGGDVNLVTSSNALRRDTDNFDDAVRQEISSNIRYSKNWPDGGRQFNVSGSQRQQLQSGAATLTLPTVSFSQSQFKPFAREQAVGDERWYEKITTQYSLDVRNQYAFNPRDPEQLRQRNTREDSLLADRIEDADIQWYDALTDRDRYELATGNDDPFQFEAEHAIPLSASFRLNRFNANISPNVNYRSTWYLSTTRLTATFDTTETNGETRVTLGQSEEETVPGFYARHDVTTSLSTGTEVYGTFPVGIGPFQGLRHRASPSIGFSYTPNFNASFWGRTRTLRGPDGEVVRVTDDGEVVDGPQGPGWDGETPVGQPVRYDIRGGNRVSGSTERRSMNFGLNNTFETKRVRVDSTGEVDRETIQLLNATVNTSYNFAADSLKLADVSLSARTRFRQFSFSTNFGFSPYRFVSVRDPGSETVRFTEVDRYMATGSPWTPVRLTNFRATVRGSFEGERRSGGSGQGARGAAGRQGQSPYGGRGGPQSGRPGAGGRGPGSVGNDPYGRSAYGGGYVDFGVPWSLSFDLNYSIRKPFNEVTSRTASVGLDAQLSPTPNWSMDLRSGYDFIQREITNTSIRMNRNLGCWTMSFFWEPFGEFQTYGFRLQVTSGQLSQLLRLQIPRSGEGRLGGFGDQVRGAASGFAGGGGGRLGSGF